MTDPVRPVAPRDIIETREVLAGAYLDLGKRRGRMLSHAVFVNRDRMAIEVLCRRVVLDNLADRGASDPTAPPTCQQCQRAIARIRGQRR